MDRIRRSSKIDQSTLIKLGQNEEKRLGQQYNVVTRGRLTVLEAKKSVAELPPEKKAHEIPEREGIERTSKGEVHPFEQRRVLDSWVQVYQVVAERVLQRFADQRGCSVASAREQLDAKVVELIEKCNPWIRVTPEVLTLVLQGGRFKSQFETHASRGMRSPELRAAVEHGFHGYAVDMEPQLRPISAYLSDDPSGRTYNIGSYGSIAVGLSDRLAPRITVTIESPLALVHKGWVIGHPVPMNELSMEALSLITLNQPHPYSIGGRADPLTWRSVRDMGKFTEAQVHGGLRVSDITKVIFYDPKKAVEHPELLAMLYDQGIPHFFESPQLHERDTPLMARLQERSGSGGYLKYIQSTETTHGFLKELGLPINIFESLGLSNEPFKDSSRFRTL